MQYIRNAVTNAKLSSSVLMIYVVLILTTPKQVDGHSRYHEGRRRAARDGVPPRDGHIEVEFREGAKSVFDDPRYLDQEGPTLGGPGV